MKRRYRCPRHHEKTASAVVYGNSFFCFGCHARGPVSELGLSLAELEQEESYIEDLEESIAYISYLPLKKVRGFQLHSDYYGYFLVWPDNTYYKWRSANPEAKSKYRGPSGHKKPPFVLPGSYPRTILCEGEFNALSLYSCCGESLKAKVISPGGSGDFYSNTGKKFLRSIAKSEHIDIIVDNDTAGVLAGIETKMNLVVMGCESVKVHLMEKDFNDIHQEEGREGVIARATQMGLLC